MAGAVGFEPTDGGTKNRCLTTWLRPKGIACTIKRFQRNCNSLFNFVLTPYRGGVIGVSYFRKLLGVKEKFFQN